MSKDLALTDAKRQLETWLTYASVGLYKIPDSLKGEMKAVMKMSTSSATVMTVIFMLL